MKSLSAIMLVALGSVAVVVITLLLAPLGGAFAGAIFGFFFPETAFAVLTALNLNIAFWQFGAVLGFVGGFFRTAVTTKG